MAISLFEQGGFYMLLKKRILPLALSAIMAVSALTGCGSS